jgi:hypothetical protein
LAVISWVPITFAFSQRANGIESQNVIMGIDAMVINHQGLFRSANPADGYNTFSFGNFAAQGGSQSRYNSFYFIAQRDANNTTQGGVGPSPRLRSFTPEHWNGAEYLSAAPLDITNAYLPIIDRATFGAMFDPAEYQLEVKFKPNLGGGLPANEAATFGVGVDQLDGYVLDPQTGLHKRAAENFTYTIGSQDVPINTWYASAPKDADGFATWTVPVADYNFAQRSYWYNYGDATFRNDHVITGGGRVDNGDGTWSDVIDGFDTDQFGSPLGSLNTPNGLGAIGMSSAFDGPDSTLDLSIEVKSIAVAKVNPGSIVARLDAHSGITYRFGSGFTRSNTATPINVNGFDFLPAATDQISRFDENGMTNLKLQMRTPDNENETHRFILRDAPAGYAFDGTTATVNIRAKLLASNTATSMTIVAKDLDGNDCNSVSPSQGCFAANPVGGEAYNYVLDLSQFNSSTFTTVSVPLSAFTLVPHVAYVGGDGGTFGSGFLNPGDGSISSFNLYEFGGLITPGSGLLGMELEYLEIRLPGDTLPGDFDKDGDVDGRDFLVWQRGGSPMPLSAGDLATWKANYGNGTLSAVSAVPEPSTALLLTLLGTTFFACRRK